MHHMAQGAFTGPTVGHVEACAVYHRTAEGAGYPTMDTQWSS
jgi:hypothetical protein